MSSSAMPASLADATRARPALARITQCVLDTWPEHRDYLDVRFGGSGRFHLDFCEEISGLVLSIAGEDLPRFAENYRWTCDRMLEEEYRFSMTGKYRFATFAEVVRGIGLDADYMARYTDGLLVSQLLWANHAHVLSRYLSDFLAAVRPGFSLLEVGPGHGLLLALAAERGVRTTGWDLNEGSIASTSHALARMGHSAQLRCQDLHGTGNGELFDHVVASELLEHVDDPDAALRRIRHLTRPGGTVFINIPVNSPAPDHINLWRTPEEVASYVRSSGLEIDRTAVFPMTGYTEQQARTSGSTLSCVLICRR